MIPASSSRPSIPSITPMLNVVAEQPLVPGTAVTLPAVSIGRKRATIERGAYWSRLMKEVLLGGLIQDSQGMSKVLVPLSQIQSPDPILTRERLGRAQFTPSSFSDFCALAHLMFFNEGEEMRTVACLGTGFPWKGKEMFAQTSGQSNGERHLRLFQWGTTDATRYGAQISVLCDRISKH